jgi:prepilin peptidase CpaA
MTSIAVSIFFGLLAAAAIFDFFTLRIPNILVICIAILYVVFGFFKPNMFSFDHVSAAATCLLAGLLLYFAGGVGAGDVKLFSAVALWTGFNAFLPFLLITSLCGVLVLAILALARALPDRAQTLLKRFLPQAKSLDSPNGVPYGVAIAIGAISVGIFYSGYT